MFGTIGTKGLFDMEIDAALVKAIIGAFVALITLLTVLVEKTRRDNNKDHATVRERLDMIKDSVGELKQDIRDDIKEIKSDVHILREEFHDHLFHHHDNDVPKRRGRPSKS